MAVAHSFARHVILFLLLGTALGSGLIAEEGEMCVDNFINCRPGLLCLISRIDKYTSMGTCINRRIFHNATQAVPQCTLQRCNSPFSAPPCVLGGIATTCAIWSRREDGGPRPKCQEKCPRKCDPLKSRFRTVFKTYCNPCIYFRHRCRRAFQIPFPIPPTSVQIPPRKCKGGPCRGLWQKCTKSRNGKSVFDCKRGLVCGALKITDEKNINGICIPFQDATLCSAPYCARYGRKRFCLWARDFVYMTCGAWSGLPSGEGRKCSVTCPDICTYGRSGRASRKGYCNLCKFVRLSCKTGFRLTSSFNGWTLRTPGWRKLPNGCHNY